MARTRKYRQAKFVQSLYEYDGPKLVLLKTPGTSYILGAAIIDHRYEQPFYGAEISAKQLNELLADDFSVRYAFIRPRHKQWFVFDLADLDASDEINLLPLRLSPETLDYLPGRELFASDFTEEVHLGISQQPKAEERILVNGNWELADFSDLYGGYSDLYSFEDGLDKYEDAVIDVSTRRLVKEAFRKQWQGGGSYGSFYRSLKVVQAHSERLTLGGFQYNSPGWVDIEGQSDLLEAVKHMLTDFSDRYTEIGRAYNELYKYLQANKLLSMSADRFDKSSRLATNVAERGLAFSKILPGSRWPVLLDLSDNDPLVATKVLLSLYRRLNRLNDFQLQGRATF